MQTYLKVNVKVCVFKALHREKRDLVLAELEASGGINLETARAKAESGVERISVGAITHSAKTFDIGLDWVF